MDLEQIGSKEPLAPITNKTPIGIIHSEDEKESIFSAVGVLKRDLPSDFKGDGICIFSQEKLTDCDEPGCIVISKNFSGSLVWKFLCNTDIELSDPGYMYKGVHVFETSYLTQWVKNNGTKYIQCPLCKEGVQQAKKIEEHQIDSIDQLQERRRNAKRSRDLPLLFFIEQLILAQICESNWDDLDPDRAKANEDILRDVLNHWFNQGQRDNFLEKVMAGLEKVVKKDMSNVVKILLARGIRGSHPRKKEIIKQLAVLAAKNNAFSTIKLLAEEFDLEFGLRPITLLEAIKSMNIDMVKYIMEVMEKRQSRHVCDDVFQEVIKKDMVEVAKTIIIQRWHKPNDRDFTLAQRLDGNSWQYLASRRNAARSIVGGMDGELIESDDWGADDDDDNSFGDDDWECWGC